MRLAALLLAASAAHAADSYWTLNLFPASAYPEARCLDGTQAGHYLKRGDPSKWIIGFQGGGWCTSYSDCVARSKTDLGSSSTWPTTTTRFGGIYSMDPSQNPGFSTWTSSQAPYGDGASFAGYVAQPVNVNGTALYFRGAKVLEAYLETLLAAGIANATEVIVTGGSAGGLATLLHVDYVAARLRAANPSISVKALADCSFFINAVDVFGRAYYTGLYQWVAAAQNVSGGHVNDACLAATPASNAWQCFMAQFTYPHITTPLFLIQSSEDAFQLPNFLAPPGDGADASYAACFNVPATACNQTQFQQFMGYRTQWYAAWNMSLAFASPASRAANGAAVTSCVEHGQEETGIWDVVHIDGVTLQAAFAAWYAGAPTGRGGDPSTGSGYYFYDAPWGKNPTCTGPKLH